MAGMLMYQYAETILTRNYGENKITYMLIDALPTLEAIYQTWQEKKKDSKKK